MATAPLEAPRYATSGGREPEISRHPDATELERDPTAFKSLDIVTRLQQDPIAFTHAELTQCIGHGVDARINLRPGPFLVTLYQGSVLRVERGGMGEQTAQIHHLGRFENLCTQVDSSMLR